MHPNAQLIHTLYSAFQKRDGDTMASCYHPDAEFTDEAFVGLRHAGVTSMWRMLTERAKDFSLEFRDVQADDRTGRAHWEARYTFASTGRKVLNIIDAEFEFRDGKILRHRDRFNFHRWSRQALGTPGLLLGWTPFFQKKVQATARAGLDKWMREHGVSGP
ncbi:nuclear transport factor 2 family protein [Hyalangium versicolor]|uniref:nuclear transport factor 2 family protein n=1 Tax=Hyalangium versicolor TaxID=2861190 RepID=UPI001CCF1884|nr:nuclear transport factor 2 family protein [Hyalangium versicolor]